MTDKALEKERARLALLKDFDRVQARGLLPAGLDEAGRGPLFGPVVAAAVVLDPEKEILYINDSKKLSEKRREAVYPQIMEKALGVGVGIVSAARIDEINILQATYEAMKQALASLPVSCPYGILLLDAITLPGLNLPQIPIIKGDGKSLSIAAASIVAKVSRDRLMAQAEERYPGYGLAQHKGYGTAAHMEALRRLGPTPEHRKSFIIKILE